MTDEPDLTERQQQVLRALMAEKLAADIDPTEVGGLANDALAQQLGVREDEIRRGAAGVCGYCTADSFGVKAIHKLIDAYPDPIAVIDVEDHGEEDR
jgi:hypothetical protein